MLCGEVGNFAKATKLQRVRDGSPTSVPPGAVDSNEGQNQAAGYCFFVELAEYGPVESLVLVRLIEVPSCV